MSIPLRLLLLEDNLSDAELIVHELRRAGFDPRWQRVETEPAFLAGLDPAPELVLADYSLPQFDGLRAFDLMVERGLDIPFILVSGVLGEEKAVAAMKKGVADYLLKDRLARLGQAVTSALDNARERNERIAIQRALKASELRYRRLFESAQNGILILDAETGAVVDVNPFLTDLLGFSYAELAGKKLWELGFWEDIFASQETFAELKQQRYVRYEDLPLKTADGRRVDVEFVSNLYPVNGQDVIQCNIRDITERKQAESERGRLFSVLEASLNEVYMFDVETLRFTYMNNSALRNLGYLPGTISTMTPLDIKPEFSEATFQTQIEPLRRRQKDKLIFQTVHRRADDTRYPVEVHLQLVEQEGSAIFLAIINDITERKRAEEDLHGSEERFRSWIENSSDLVTVIGENGTIQYASPSYERVLGYQPEELIGTSGFDLVHLEDFERVLQIFAQNIQTVQSTASAEFRYRHRDGSWRMFEAVGRAYKDKRGQMAGLINSRDITERKRAEEALRENEEFLSNLLENAPVSVYITDADGRLLLVNRQWEKDTGKPRTDVLGLPLDEIFPAELAQSFAVDNRTVIEAGVPHSFEETIGSQHLFTIKFPLRDGQGALTSVGGISLDITERKRVEARNEMHLQRLAALRAIDTAITSTLDLPSVLNVILDQIARVYRRIDAACVLLVLDPSSQTLTYAAGRGFKTNGIERSRIPFGEGLPGEALRERRVVSLSNPIQSPVVLRADLLAEEDFVGYFAAPMITKDRVVGVLEVFQRTPNENDDEWLSFLETLAGQAAIAVESAALFAESQRLLHEAQAHAQLTQEIIDSAPEGMLVLDSEQRLVLANPVARGYLTGPTRLAELAAGDRLTSLGGHPLANFLHSFANQQPWAEIDWGQPPRIYEVATQPLGAGQQAGGWVLVMRDVTVERDRQRYRQMQERLATVGQLAAGIAHDFNNIMGGIILYTQLLRNDPNLPTKHAQYLTVIYDQSRHAADLIRQILDFSRRAPMERAALDVTPLLKELIKLLERTLPEDVALELGYDRNKYVINGDPTRLQQMLMNLALNARDAMPQGGSLSFQLTSLTVGPDQPPPLPDMGVGEWLQLAVTDTGSGIEAEHLSHLFEPFFTTKEQGQGTGLGLAQVYGIVKQHDGSIRVESQVGRGTTFTIYLPLHKTALSPAQPAVTNQTQTGDGETILLVEDNSATRMAVGDSLEGLGYRVLSATDGVEALEVLAEHAAAISLMLSDLVMPRMGGVELARTARRRHPSLKIVIMTGHPLRENEDELRQAGIEGWMRKPFTIDELAEQVQMALGVKKQLGSD